MPAAGVLAVTVGAGPVRNVQLTEVSGLFAMSLIAAAPPVNRTVYLVSAVRFAVGLMVSTRVVVLNVTADGTSAPVAAVPTRIVAVAVLNPVIASLKVAVAFTVTAWLVALFAGVSADAVGGVVSAAAPVVNVHVVLASGLFAPSRMPVVALPVSVTVYTVLGARLAVGFSVNWFAPGPAVTAPASNRVGALPNREVRRADALHHLTEGHRQIGGRRHTGGVHRRNPSSQRRRRGVRHRGPGPGQRDAVRATVALSVTTKVPVRVPAADGVKVTLVVQLAPAARVAPQVVAPFVKLVALVPPIAMLVMFSVAPPVLVRVTVCAALVVPIVVLPKTSGADSDAAAGAVGAVGVTALDRAENAP